MHFILNMFKVTCPKCKCESYIKEDKHGACVHCGADLDKRNIFGLKPQPYTVQVIINQHTGDAAIIPQKTDLASGLFDFAVGLNRSLAKLGGDW